MQFSNKIRTRYIYWSIIVVLLIGLTVSSFKQSNLLKKISSSTVGLEDSLILYKQLSEANYALFIGDDETAQELYKEVANKVQSHTWSGLVFQFIQKRDSLIALSDSLQKEREGLINQNIFKKYQIDTLKSSLVNSQHVLDSVRNQFLKTALDLNASIVSNQKLSNEISVIKSAHGKLNFFNPKGKNVNYYGEVKDEKANGYGIGIFDSKGVYEGQWKNNERHGKGKYTWVNGDKYEGDFNDDLRHGYGIYLFSTGEKYVGNWKNDLRNGKGTFYSKEGKVLLDGTWTNDKFNRNAEEPVTE
jgi:hypothetical protein